MMFFNFVSVIVEHEEEVLGEPFTFEDLFSGDYSPRHFTSKWIDGMTSHSVVGIFHVESEIDCIQIKQNMNSI